MTGIIIKSY